MPWVVNECGRRGAIGGVRGLFLSIVLVLGWYRARNRAGGNVILGFGRRIARSAGFRPATRRVGKGALAPCPPLSQPAGKWWARFRLRALSYGGSGRFAHPTILAHGPHPEERALARVSKDEWQDRGLMALKAMPTGRANARPMTGSASSKDARSRAHHEVQDRAALV